MCQMMMRSIRPPESKQATTLQVAVRCRPLSAKEKLKTRDILRVVDGKVVVVLDPDLSKEYLDRVQNRSKEKKYAFDVAFGPESTNEVPLLRCATFVIHIVGMNIAIHAQELTYIINCLIRMFTMPQLAPWLKGWYGALMPQSLLMVLLEVEKHIPWLGQ
jgi:hypothetical protein